MNEWKKLHLVYFSPSGTTEKTVRTIASGFEGLEVTAHNLLPYASRREKYIFCSDDCIKCGTCVQNRCIHQERFTYGG